MEKVKQVWALAVANKKIAIGATALGAGVAALRRKK